MYIVEVASECAPVAKVGGLADVVYGLSGELQARGHDVEIILPKYDCMHYEHLEGLQVVYHGLWVPWHDGLIHCSVWSATLCGRSCFLIDPHGPEDFFGRGHYYGSWDDVTRFAFFSKATLEFLLKSNRRPAVIHCHDWQTALVPVLLYEIYAQAGMDRQRVCYTVHDFRYQGVTGEHVLWATGLNRPDYFLHTDRLGDHFNPNALNLMQGGIVYANFVTTVSLRHAWEAQTMEHGDGLGRALRMHQGKFGGVLNGIDDSVWNPASDPRIVQDYGPDCLDRKYANKEALRDRLWLAQSFKPLVAYVGSLERQKGVDLVRHGLFYSIWNNAQFVLLGTGSDSTITSYFWHLKQHLNDNPDCHLEIAHNDELAHLLYAGADLIIVPSLFEPCGESQMIALRYGAVPIVHAVGGLVDTVFDRDYSTKPPSERNGYVFQHTDQGAMESALRRAFGLWYDYPQEFRQLMINGMRYDFSWKRPGQDYSNIFDYIRYK
ncbi:MAG: glycogen synthase [Gammaproteobacteria bacterium]|nr:glycogen synthase [Gammaproteobacteria bacterium]